MSARIAVPEFRERLEALCLGGAAPGLPRRRRDRAILLGAAALALEPRRRYREEEINAALAAWLAGPGRRLELDHVTLRRCMVDDGFLRRDARGASYAVDRDGRGPGFEAGVAEVDVAAVLAEAVAERARRRAERG